MYQPPTHRPAVRPLAPSPDEATPYARAVRLAERDGDTSEQAVLLEAAAASGDGRACYALATWWLRGFGAFDRSPERAMPLLRRAAADGVVEAMYDLGVSYDQGIGEDVDARQAHLWWMRAAARGDADAMRLIAEDLACGRGVHQDEGQAEVWRALGEALGAGERPALGRKRAPSLAARRKRAQAMAARGCVVTVRVGPGQDWRADAVIVGVGARLVVLQLLADGYDLDGYLAVPWKHLLAIEAPGNAAAVAKLLAAREQRPTAPAVSCSSLGALMQDLARQRVVVGVTDTDDTLLVGALTASGQLATRDTAGVASGVARIRLAQVASVAWGSRYLDAVAVMARQLSQPSAIAVRSRVR